MRKSVKKVISGVLAGMMILTAAPISAMAADYQLGDVIADSDVCAPQTLQPKIDVVWTPYTGKGGAFVNDGDESWVADGTTVNDLSKHSVEGKTVVAAQGVHCVTSGELDRSESFDEHASDQIAVFLHTFEYRV